MAVDSYSRMVAWLKVILPLAALAILSTLFLLSRAIDPTATIPFAETEVEDRMRDQQVTGPFYSATTSSGDRVAFMADRLTTDPNNPGSNRAEKVQAQIDTVHGSRITLRSDIATVNVPRDQTEFTGDVIVTTSSGYEIRSEALVAHLSDLFVRSPDAVSADSPLGTLTAGEFTLSSPQPGTAPQLVFTNGVKLVYQPKQVED